MKPIEEKKGRLLQIVYFIVELREGEGCKPMPVIAQSLSTVFTRLLHLLTNHEQF